MNLACAFPALLLTALLLVAALAACGGGDPTPRSGRSSAQRQVSDRDDSRSGPTEEEERESSSGGVLGRMGSENTEEATQAGERERSGESQGSGTSGGVMSRIGGEEGGRTRRGGDSEVKFVSVSAGNRHTCGITAAGSIICWGDNSYGQATSRAGNFAAVTVGFLHTCALNTSGGVSCWGDPDVGMTQAPAGEFKSIGNGGRYNCGVKTDGSIECWGWSASFRDWSPEGEFTSVSVGGNKCALRTDGTVTCSSNDPVKEQASGPTNPDSTSAPEIKRPTVAPGAPTNTPIPTPTPDPVWVWAQSAPIAPPEGLFDFVTVGGHTCGLMTDGVVACWIHSRGSLHPNLRSAASPPEGRFISVSAGPAHTAGWRLTGPWRAGVPTIPDSPARPKESSSTSARVSATAVAL